MNDHPMNSRHIHPRPVSRFRLPLKYTQNFLRDPILVRRLIEAAEVRTDIPVLEIGPGKGIITSALAEKGGTAGRVVAVELDSALVDALTLQFRDLPQVQIVHADILAFDLAQFGGDYTVFANIPFHITTQILERVFDPSVGPQAAALILQTNALLDRGRKEANTLKSLLIQPWYEITVLHEFSPDDFSPRPSVDTALFGFVRRPEPLLSPEMFPLYRDFLAFISRDRVGEGSWKRLFGRRTKEVIRQHKLLSGKGLKSQRIDGLLHVFHKEVSSTPETQQRIRGAWKQLRREQENRKEET